MFESRAASPLAAGLNMMAYLEDVDLLNGVFFAAAADAAVAAVPEEHDPVAVAADEARCALLNAPHLEPASVTLVAGPATITFPHQAGWRPEWSPPAQRREDAIFDLQHLTVRRLTRYFTLCATAGKRPNCEEAWQKRFPGQPIPWKKIWDSLGR